MKFVFAVFWLVFSFCPVSAYAEPFKITWVVSDTPPFHIEEGKLSNQGICDNLTREIELHNPEVEFETLVAPEARISKMLDSGEPVCFPCMIHRDAPTSRSAYSIPTHLYPPFVVIVSKRSLDKFKTLGSPIDINNLLNAPNLILGKEIARKYGSLQQTIVSSNAYKNAVISHRFDTSTESIAELLRKGRIDYTIDYPTTFNYFKYKGYTEFVMLPIDKKQSYVKGAIGCSASNPDFSNKALTIINKSLTQSVLQSETYQRGLNYWMEGYPGYWQEYEKQIIQSN